MYTRQQVYLACLLASTKGIDCMAFGNATGRSNRGQYKSTYYQGLAALFAAEAEAIGFETLWRQYESIKA